jgi:putative acetyltransferase
MRINIRSETTKDISAIYQVNKLAFARENEAHLVNRLREEDAVILSLVAVLDERIVGHILFSPVTITNDDYQWQAVGLGPMAVLPEYQNQRIGSALIRSGLDELRKLGLDVVIVLGHPEYYPRFGFKPSKPFGIQWEIDVPEEVFMVAELNRETLNGRAGIVRYHSAFKDV